MVRRGSLVGVFLTAVLLSVPLSALPAAAQQGNARVELLGIDPAGPVAGQEVVFTWRVSDPDPFAGVTSFDLHYGDHPHQPPTGTPLLCGDLLQAGGLDHTFKTFHRYTTSGSYVITATVTTRQTACGVALGEPDRSPGIEVELDVG